MIMSDYVSTQLILMPPHFIFYCLQSKKARKVSGDATE